MLYKKIAPSPPLAPFVECYYVWEARQPSSRQLLVESPPNGFTSMVFNYGGTYRIDNAKLQDVVVPTAFLSGQSTRSYRLRLQGDIGMVGVVFKPAGLGTLFGLPMYEFSDQRTGLADGLGRQATA